MVKNFTFFLTKGSYMFIPKVQKIGQKLVPLSKNIFELF